MKNDRSRSVDAGDPKAKFSAYRTVADTGLFHPRIDRAVSAEVSKRAFHLPYDRNGETAA